MLRSSPGRSAAPPADLSIRRVVIRTTLLATVLFGLFLANYVNGWITPQMLDVTRI